MILVVGATGRVGGAIVRSLLRQEQRVRILARSGPGYPPLADAGAQPAEGDLKDPASLARACRGAEAVITTASAGERGGADSPQTVDLEGNRNLIDAAREAGVRRFVFVSALFASEQSPSALLRAKAATEAYLKGSGLSYTVLAPNGLLDVMLPQVVGWPLRAGHPVALVGEGRRRHSLMAARDVAAFAVAALTHPAAANRRLPLGGPEAVSWRDVVAAYERVLGRPVPVRTIAPGELLPHVPPVPGLAEFLSGLLAAMETFDSVVEMEETARTFGVRLTPLEEVVRFEAEMVPTATPG